MSQELVLMTWKVVHGIPKLCAGRGLVGLLQTMEKASPGEAREPGWNSGSVWGHGAPVVLLLPGGCHRSSCGKSISALEILALKRLTAKFIIQASQVDAKSISFNGMEDYF